MPDVSTVIDSCPKCGSGVWDNRTDKKSPRSPDFKCKDKDNCGEGYWLVKDSSAKAAPRRGGPVTAARYSEPEHDVEVTREVRRIQSAAEGHGQSAAHAAIPTQVVVGKVYDIEQLQTNMAECFKFALDLFDETGVDKDPRALAQICDTLFIERQRRGA